MENQKHSRWRRKQDDRGQTYDKNGRSIMIFCPFCEHEAYYNTDYGYYETFDFCPYCGHKMVKENKEAKIQDGEKK